MSSIFNSSFCLGETTCTIPALAETNPEMAPEIIDEAPLVIEDQTQQLKKISRTTQWRKMAKELRGEVAQVKKPRKEYSCNKCNHPMTFDGHTQFKGKRFCSATEGKSKEQWLAEMRIAKSN